MKKIFICMAVILAVIFPEINARKVYAELLGTQKGLFTNKVKVTVDFGQNVSSWKSGDMTLVDNSGKDIIFNSMVDAMNFMGQYGWEFVQAYAVSNDRQNVYHWLMTKDVNSDEEIHEGFNVRADIKETSYVLQFYKKASYKDEWELVKTETKSSLSSEQLDEIISNWESQSNDKTEYMVRAKKSK